MTTISNIMVKFLDKMNIEYDFRSGEEETILTFKYNYRKFEVVDPFYSRCYIIMTSASGLIQKRISFKYLMDILKNKNIIIF